MLWSGASVDDITKYQQYVDLYLDSIYVPVESLLCKYYNCDNSYHCDELRFFFVYLIKCIISATKKSIPFSNCITNTNPVRMSGWNIDMSIAREKSLFLAWFMDTLW